MGDGGGRRRWETTVGDGGGRQRWETTVGDGGGDGSEVGGTAGRLTLIRRGCGKYIEFFN